MESKEEETIEAQVLIVGSDDPQSMSYKLAMAYCSMGIPAKIIIPEPSKQLELGNSFIVQEADMEYSALFLRFITAEEASVLNGSRLLRRKVTRMLEKQAKSGKKQLLN